MLERDEHDHIPAAETHEVGSETLVERDGALFFKHASDHTRNRFSASRLSIHNSCLEHIDWRSDTYSDETGAESARNMRDKTVGHANGHSVLLKLIVGSKLSCIDDRVTHDIGEHSDPEAANTILLHCFLIAVHTGFIGSILWFQLALSLHTDLDKISWVRN